MIATMIAITPSLGPVLRQLHEDQATPQQTNKALIRIVNDNPVLRQRLMIGGTILMIASLAGVVFGLVGLLRRGQPKTMALTGLLLSAPFVLCQCLGGILMGG